MTTEQTKPTTTDVPYGETMTSLRAGYAEYVRELRCYSIGEPVSFGQWVADQEDRD